MGKITFNDMDAVQIVINGKTEHGVVSVRDLYGEKMLALGMWQGLKEVWIRKYPTAGRGEDPLPGWNDFKKEFNLP